MESPNTIRGSSIETSLTKKTEKENEATYSGLERAFREKYHKQTAVIEKNFDLKGEFVLDHYACSHLGTLLKPGRLFITPKYVLFYSNLLGSKTKKKIAFDKILEIKNESSAFVATPIEINLKFKRYTFASFIHRDQCYKNLLLQWKSNKEGAPYDIKIPLDPRAEAEDDASPKSKPSKKGEGEEEEEEVPHQMPALQSVWGTSTREPDMLELDPDAGLESMPPPPKKKGIRGTLSQMPSFYSKDSNGKRRACPCWPW